MNLPQAKTTLADYLDFERGSTERHQFVDGEILAMAGESLGHSTINTNIILFTGLDSRAKAGTFFPRSREPVGLHLHFGLGRMSASAQPRVSIGIVRGV